MDDQKMDTGVVPQYTLSQDEFIAQFIVRGPQSLKVPDGLKLPFTVSLVAIGPHNVDYYLGATGRNRNISPYRVNMYSRDMLNKQWPLLPDAIIIDAAGRVRNGQHRLVALKKTGATCVFLVFQYNDTVIDGCRADEAALSVLDSGKARTAGDNLNLLDEIKRGTDKSAAARVIQVFNMKRIYANSSYSKGDVSNLELRQFVKENDASLTDSLVRAQPYESIVKGLPRAWVVAFHFLAKEKDSDLVDPFFEAAFKTGGYSSSLGRMLPNLAELNTKLLKQYRSTTKHTPGYLFGLLVKAWNAIKTDEVIKVFRMGDTEQVPPLL